MQSEKSSYMDVSDKINTIIAVSFEWSRQKPPQIQNLQGKTIGKREEEKKDLVSVQVPPQKSGKFLI